jgi:Flp pilus assembly protein TadD
MNPLKHAAAALAFSFLTALPAIAQRAPAPAQDSIARQAIIGALTGDDSALRQSYAAATQTPTASAGPVALSEAVYYLYNNTRTNREEFLAGQEILAANARNKDWQNRVLLSLLSDEAYELNRLEGQNRFNKYTRIFNRVSTSLSQLVMLQPQAAASLLWDGIYSVREGKAATIKERKMVYLCEQFLKKYPDAPERAEVVALRGELKHKMLNDRFKALSAAGKTAMTDGQFQLAEWHLEKANLLNPADADTKQLLGQARALKVRTEEVRGLTLGVSDSEANMSTAQAKALGEIARAVALGDSKALDKLRTSVPYVWDSVDYSYAALAEKSGNHQSAIQRLQGLATSAPSSPGGRAATKLLDNPNFNLSESYRAALAEMASEKSKFIWTGRRTKDETVYATGNAMIQSAGNPAGVPVLFGMDAAVRAISEKFKTQVSVEGVVDAGARYLRRYPDSPRKQEIARQLADLSKKAGDYNRSMEYLEESGTGSATDVEKLKENQATALFEQIRTSGDLLERKKLLQQMADKYPNAKITQKNLAKEQAKLPPGLAPDTIVLPGKALSRDQRLASYLGVPTAFVDNAKSNGELADEGVAITPSANLVEYKLKNENSWRRVGLRVDSREWVLTASRQLRSDFMSSEEGRQLLYRQKLPVAIEGGVGGGGVDIAPQILPYKTTEQDQRRFN